MRCPNGCELDGASCGACRPSGDVGTEVAADIREAWHETGFYGRADLSPGVLDGLAMVASDALAALMDERERLAVQRHVETKEVARVAVDFASPESKWILDSAIQAAKAAALREAADEAVPRFNTHPLNLSNTIAEWLRLRAAALDPEATP